jgi:hypothetical protein
MDLIFKEINHTLNVCFAFYRKSQQRFREVYIMSCRAGIRVKVRGPTRLTRSPHGLKTKFFLSVYIFPHMVWTVKTTDYAG